MVETFTGESDTVLDPFLGSGTILKVCGIMNRVGIGYEINEDYRELITRRINEKWAVPDWRQIDLIHSTTMEPGMKEPRKLQFLSLKRAQQKLL